MLNYAAIDITVPLYVYSTVTVHITRPIASYMTLFGSWDHIANGHGNFNYYKTSDDDLTVGVTLHASLLYYAMIKPSLVMAKFLTSRELITHDCKLRGRF